MVVTMAVIGDIFSPRERGRFTLVAPKPQVAFADNLVVFPQFYAFDRLASVIIVPTRRPEITELKTDATDVSAIRPGFQKCRTMMTLRLSHR
jgi:hypothetical protein